MSKRVCFIVTLAAVLVLGSLLAGCIAPREKAPETKTGQKPDPGQQPVKTPGDYFPLLQGSTWKYRGEGNEYASFTTKVLYTKGNRAQTGAKVKIGQVNSWVDNGPAVFLKFFTWLWNFFPFAASYSYKNFIEGDLYEEEGRVSFALRVYGHAPVPAAGFCRL